MRANMLANRRAVAPRGIAGGCDAEPGRNWVERADGSREELGATGWADMRPGDRFVVLTPGGGGYGPHLLGVKRIRPPSRLTVMTCG